MYTNYKTVTHDMRFTNFNICKVNKYACRGTGRGRCLTLPCFATALLILNEIKEKLLNDPWLNVIFAC